MGFRGFRASDSARASLTAGLGSRAYTVQLWSVRFKACRFQGEIFGDKSFRFRLQIFARKVWELRLKLGRFVVSGPIWKFVVPCQSLQEPTCLQSWVEGLKIKYKSGMMQMHWYSPVGLEASCFIHLLTTMSICIYIYIFKLCAYLWMSYAKRAGIDLEPQRLRNPTHKIGFRRTK